MVFWRHGFPPKNEQTNSFYFYDYLFSFVNFFSLNGYIIHIFHQVDFRYYPPFQQIKVMNKDQPVKSNKADKKELDKQA